MVKLRTRSMLNRNFLSFTIIGTLIYGSLSHSLLANPFTASERNVVRHFRSVPDRSTSWSEVAPIGPLPIVFYASGSTLFAGTGGNGIYRSSTNGQSWESSSTGLFTGAKIRAFAALDSKLFAGTDQGVWASTNEGQNWNPVNTGLPDSPGSRAILALESSGATIYAEIEKPGGNASNKLFRSTDSGQSWTEIKIDFPISSGRLLMGANGSTLFVRG